MSGRSEAIAILARLFWVMRVIVHEIASKQFNYIGKDCKLHNPPFVRRLPFSYRKFKNMIDFGLKELGRIWQISPFIACKRYIAMPPEYSKQTDNMDPSICFKISFTSGDAEQLLHFCKICLMYSRCPFQCSSLSAILDVLYTVCIGISKWTSTLSKLFYHVIWDKVRGYVDAFLKI